MYKPEIEQVLTQHLGRVRAPEELWERMETLQPRVPMPQRARVRALIVVAALILIGVVVQTRRRAVEMEGPQPQHTTACFLCHAGG